MTKRFTLWAACALSTITLVPGQEDAPDMANRHVDHERLVDLVLTLQEDFGETLADYAKLQTDYSKLLDRPEVPDQSGKVRELQKKLQATTDQLNKASHEQENATIDPLVLGDLKALRTELHQERAGLLVAKVQVAQAQKLEVKAVELENQLKTETARSAELTATLQTIRGERDALLARVDGMLKQADEDKMARLAANERIKVLEKETVTLKEQISHQDVVIAQLKKEASSNEAMAKTVDTHQKEEVRLAELLKSRETELAKLRDSLVVEKERSVDVPLMLKAKEEMEVTLAARAAELADTRSKLAEVEQTAAKAEALEEENQALSDKYHRLAADFEALKTSIDSMEGELVKNRETMVKAMETGVQVKELELKRDQLSKDLKAAQTQLAKVEGDLKNTSTSLSEVEGRLVLAKEEGALQKNKAEALATERVALLATLDTAEKEVKKSAETVMQADRIKKDYDALRVQAGELEKEKASLLKDLAAREEVLVALRAEVAAVPALTAKVTTLEEEKRVIAAKLSNGLAAQKALKLELDDAAMETRRANESAALAGKVKGDVAVLEEEKAAITEDLENREAELQALRAEMASKPDLTDRLAELEGEKKDLASRLAEREADLTKTRNEMGKLHLDSASMEKTLVALKRSTVEINPVRYAKGEADVTDQQARVFGQVKQVLDLFPTARFEIVGHTCDIGYEEANLKLSVERAEALRDFLVSKGIPAERLKFRGMGDAEPMVPNSSEENRRKNRRVEIEILD